MRCTNCGWDNPEGIERCQKCNQSLRNGSFFNTKATMIDVNPRSTILDNNQSYLRVTEREVNPRATLVDVPARSTMLENSCLEITSLVCLDDNNKTEITISSPEPLSISKGDVILIGGLRYQIK